MLDEKNSNANCLFVKHRNQQCTLNISFRDFTVSNTRNRLKCTCRIISHITAVVALSRRKRSETEERRVSRVNI